MRPTIDEQLNGACRILESVVAPAVATPYASDILRALISNLRMLTAALPELQDFLAWDNSENAALLTEMRGVADAGLADQIDSLLQAEAPSPTDQDALNRRNEDLRALLSAGIRSGTLPETLSARLAAHFSERAARNPIRFAITLPTNGARD